MIERLLPPDVAAADELGPPSAAGLFPEELAALAGATRGRQLEFAAARGCARRAVQDLGVAPRPLLPGPDRVPVWPAGLVGSLTHCEGYRAAAVARDGAVRAVGIDAEPHAPLPEDAAAVVLRPDDRWPSTAGVHHDRVTFSAKESVYKAWYPTARRRLDFTEVRITLRENGFFEVVLDPHVGGLPVTSGRWLVGAGLVVTAVVVPA